MDSDLEISNKESMVSDKSDDVVVRSNAVFSTCILSEFLLSEFLIL